MATDAQTTVEAVDKSNKYGHLGLPTKYSYPFSSNNESFPRKMLVVSQVILNIQCPIQIICTLCSALKTNLASLRHFRKTKYLTGFRINS